MYLLVWPNPVILLLCEVVFIQELFLFKRYSFLFALLLVISVSDQIKPCALSSGRLYNFLTGNIRNTANLVVLITV